MEGTEKPHMDEYKEDTNDWNYDANCTLTSLPVSDLETFQGLIFVAQSVQKAIFVKSCNVLFVKNAWRILEVHIFVVFFFLCLSVCVLHA
jgi:hypothetical protein